MARAKTYGEIRSTNSYYGYVYKARGKLYTHTEFYELKRNAQAKYLKVKQFGATIVRLPDGRYGVYWDVYKPKLIARATKPSGIRKGRLTGLHYINPFTGKRM